MKTTKFFVMMTALVAVMFVSCKKEKTTITLDKTSIEVVVNASVKLTATVKPAGAGEVIWSVEDPEVAIVTGGNVVGKKEGDTKVFAICGDAKAECAVKVVKGTTPGDVCTYSCLQGNNYFAIFMPQSAIDCLTSKGKSVTYIGPNGDGGAPDRDGNGKNDNSRYLWRWDNSVGDGTQMPTNFFGTMEGYQCITQISGSNPSVPGSTGYSGCGLWIAPLGSCDEDFAAIDMTDIYANPTKYFFHIALAKPEQEQYAITFTFRDGPNSVSFTFGNKPGVNNQAPRADIPRDGIWHEYEIPCTEFVSGDKMLYQNPFADTNIMEIMTLNPIAGSASHIDAVFFYKKTN